jgi:hypothetical protein
MFWASAGPKYVSRISSSEVTYEKVDRTTTPTPYETSYELPVLKAVEQTKQDQVKGGVMVSCEVTPFEATKNTKEEKEVVTADPNKPGYDIYKVGTKISYDVHNTYDQTDNIWFNIRIKNNQDRILKLKDVAIVMLIDGVAFNIPEEAKQEWVGGMLAKGFEKTQKIKGPKISGLSTDKIVYVSINDVPTEYSPAGEVLKKENFEWYYQVTRQKITKQEMVEYSYQENPVYKERCTTCSGSGKTSQQAQCSKCLGTKQLKYTDYSTGKSWVGNCDKCEGTGYITYQAACSTCSGDGNIEYPKSPMPKVTSNVTWSGWKVSVTTIPAGATITVVNPKTSQYTYAGASNTTVNWYSSNTSTSTIYPIMIEYQGKKYKVSPYDAKGNPSPEIKINFQTGGEPTIKGGQFVN